MLDVCSTKADAKCDRWISPVQNAFSVKWHQEVQQRHWAWMNPPYGDPENPCPPNCTKKKCVERGHHNRKYVPGIEDWVRRAYLESNKGLNIVCLLPARTDTKWFHQWVFGRCDEIRFIKGRLKFGNQKNSAPFPSMLAIYHGCESVVQLDARETGSAEMLVTRMLANPPPRVYSRGYAMPRRLRIRPRGTRNDDQESRE